MNKKWGGAKIWFLEKNVLDLFQTMAPKNKFLEVPFILMNFHDQETHKSR